MKRTKLAFRVLLSLATRVSFVVLCGAALSYWHLHRTIQSSTVENISTANHERAERESVIFQLAQKNQELLKRDLLAELAKGPDRQKIAAFDRLMTKYPDGTIRNRKELFDGTKQAGVFIPPNHPITPEFKSMVITMKEMCESYGKIFRAHFQDTYFSTPTNVGIIFWPELPNWALDIGAHYDISQEEYVWVADAKHNPGRRTVWTGLYLDEVAKTWMTSGETPVYRGDEHIATAGHDLMLSELTERVLSMKNGKGGYSLILRADGRLVTHPDKRDELDVRKGQYQITDSDDEYLKALFHQISKVPTPTRHPITGDLLVQAPIHGPDWLLVTVFPNSQIVSNALSAIAFVIGLAILSLIAEMIFLAVVLEREVNRPLQELSVAAEALRQGKPVDISLKREDELGQFAATFSSMSRAITERDRSLQENASQLEAKVRERTRELEDQKVIAVQQAKMASLGEMAGGVAHEINNPLAMIGLATHQSIEILSDPNPDLNRLEENLRKVTRTADRIAKIVKGLRTFSRSASLDPMQRVSLHSILHDTLSLCGERLKFHGVELRFQETEDLEIFCRPTEISQILLNLFNNAFDAVADLPEKWVELKIEKINDSEQNRVVQIRVLDSGPGISAEIVAKLMQPFFTTKAVGKGTGLGLSIAKGIAESHGGRLFVDSTMQHTCFVLELPLR